MKPNDYADHLIDIYLSGISSISNDAGWEGDSMMAKVIAFHGEIPKSTGNVQSNLSMIHAIEKLRNTHALYDDVRRVVSEMLGTYGESDKILALLARRYYQGENPKTGKRYTNADRLSAIGYAPCGVGDREAGAKEWKHAEIYFTRRVKLARQMLLEKLEKRGIAA